MTVQQSLFRSLPPSVVMQELPGQVALLFTITGCSLACRGCHSADIWPAHRGLDLTDKSFLSWLDRYQGLISSVVFFGGEWQPELLLNKLKLARQRRLLTCLYTGLPEVPVELKAYLDFEKTGGWQKERGGLAEKNTNQKFINSKTGEVLNHLFWRN